MTIHVSAAASALADIGHVLESVESPAQQLERALELLGRFVPYDRCALFDAASTAVPGVLVLPSASGGDRDDLERALGGLHRLVSDEPVPRSGPLALPHRAQGLARLAFPLVALDDAIGVLMVERHGEDYEAHHLQLLAVVAAQLGGYLANLRLQSEEKRATRAMQRAADLLERIRDGFLEFDGALRCASANPAAMRLLALSQEQVLGANLRSIPDLCGKASFVEACERALRERVPVRVDAELYPRQERWLELDVYPTELGVSVFLRDATERCVNEQFRDLLTGIIGHDLRTPLGAITVSAATLLQRGGLDGPAAQSVARIASSGARMSEMVSQLADLTRIRFGNGLPIRREQVDLAQICRDVVGELSAAHPDRDIGCDISGDLRGMWDAGRLGQLVSNLLANAVQHGSATAPIHVSARESEGEVQIEVCNQGRPIPAELLPTIFQPFRQAHSRGGTTSLGLGLFIAQSVVRAHNGTLEVTSTEDAGTTFTARLPRNG